MKLVRMFLCAVAVVALAACGGNEEKKFDAAKAKEYSQAIADQKVTPEMQDTIVMLFNDGVAELNEQLTAAGEDQAKKDEVLKSENATLVYGLYTYMNGANLEGDKKTAWETAANNGKALMDQIAAVVAPATPDAEGAVKPEECDSTKVECPDSVAPEA